MALLRAASISTCIISWALLAALVVLHKVWHVNKFFFTFISYFHLYRLGYIHKSTSLSRLLFENLSLSCVSVAMASLTLPSIWFTAFGVSWHAVMPLSFPPFFQVSTDPPWPRCWVSLKSFPDLSTPPNALSWSPSHTLSHVPPAAIWRCFHGASGCRYVLPAYQKFRSSGCVLGIPLLWISKLTPSFSRRCLVTLRIFPGSSFPPSTVSTPTCSILFCQSASKIWQQVCTKWVSLLNPNPCGWGRIWLPKLWRGINLQQLKWWASKFVSSLKNVSRVYLVKYFWAKNGVFGNL